MPRPLSLLPALVVVVAALAGPSPALADRGNEVPQRTAAARTVTAPGVDAQEPLQLTISGLDPATLPDRGPVRVRGTVTNTSNQTWTTVNIYAFMGTRPITTPTDLADQVQLDPSVYVGDRITVPGASDRFDQLAPGQKMPYRITVPRSALPAVTEAGVYWFGVHARGQADGMRETAGRARTFLPYVPPGSGQEAVAMVLPLRHHIVYAADGSLANPAAWAGAVSPGGSLATLVDIGRHSHGRPVTWLVDPAVPDAVRHLTLGNQPLSLAVPGSDTDDKQTPPVPNAATRVGSVWLRHLRTALEGSGEILALPYGNTDVAGAARHGFGVYRTARERSGTTLAPWNLPMRPAVGSPTGYIDTKAISRLPVDTTILATDELLAPADLPPDGVAPTVGTYDGRRVVFADSATLAGGPAPGDPQDQIALRQRMLSEAALRLIDDGRPLVMVLPDVWTHPLGAPFFRGMDTSWVRFTTLSDATSGAAPSLSADQIHYPDPQAQRELRAPIFAATTQLIDAGARLGSVLSGDDTVTAQTLEQALAAPSYASRLNPGAAVTRLLGARTNLEAQLDKIRIEAPPGVTLSSKSGEFSVTVVNGMDEPVTIRLEAESNPPMKIVGPDKIELPAGARSTVPLDATARSLGVHNVVLRVTDLEGRPVGAQDVLPIRAAQVSAVIWVVIGVGLALLFAAIGVRLVRRIRAARRHSRVVSAGPTAEPTDHEAAV